MDMSMSLDVVYVRVADSGGRDARHSRSGLAYSSSVSF